MPTRQLIGTDAGPAFTVRWTGRKWQRVPIPDADTTHLSAVTAVSSRDAWAVGSYHVVPNDLTLALHCT